MYEGTATGSERARQIRSNPDYKARFIYQKSDAGEGNSGDPKDFGVVELHLPENFQFNFASSFDQPFSQGLVNAPGVQNLVKFFGASLTSQSMSVQVWQGTQCPEFNLTFELIAENDPIEDILLPIRRLSKLCLPGVNSGGLLTPPGPRLDPVAVTKVLAAGLGGTVSGAIDAVTSTNFADLTKGLSSAASSVGTASKDLIKKENVENNVTLKIGRFLTFPSVVIQSVSQTYATVFDDRGLPLKASIDVSLSTWYVPVKTDVDTMIGGG